jgi:hypothetical protein
LEPTAIFDGDAGATAMESNVGAGVFDKQAVIPNNKAVINPVLMQQLINRNRPEIIISTCSKSILLLNNY